MASRLRCFWIHFAPLVIAIQQLVCPAFASAASRAPLALDYSAPAECPSAADVVHLFGQWSPSVKVVADAADAKAIRLQVVATNGGFSGSLATTSREGTAELREAFSLKCRETVETLVFAGALALDPIVGYQQPAPQPPIEVPIARAKAVPAVPTRQEGKPAVFPRWALGAGINGGVGSSLGSAAGLSMFIERRFDSLASSPSLRLRAFLWESRSTPSAAAAVELQGWSGETSGCWPTLRAKAFRMSPCAGFQLGALSAEGTGVPMPKHTTRMWAAALAEARVQAWPWRSFGIEAHIGATMALTNYRFVVVKGAESVAVYTAPRWSPLIGAGIIWQFP